jgi:type I restriction enzyme, S subunit
MASEWPTRTIDELKAKSRASIAIGPFGSRMKSDCYVPSGVPVIRGTNISDTRDLVGEMVYITPEKAEEVQSSIIVTDDLFIPHRGSIGSVGIVPRNGAPTLQPSRQPSASKSHGLDAQHRKTLRTSRLWLP